MKEKDFKMISYLRADARMPLTKMSKKTNIPVSTLFDRLRANENDIIMKHTALLNFTKLGYHTRANVALRVDKEDKDRLREYLMKHQMINSLYKINNGFDFMIEAVFVHVKDLEEFLSDLDKRFNIMDKKSFFIIEDLKREEFMADPSLAVQY